MMSFSPYCVLSRNAQDNPAAHEMGKQHENGSGVSPGRGRALVCPVCGSAYRKRGCRGCSEANGLDRTNIDGCRGEGQGNRAGSRKIYAIRAGRGNGLITSCDHSSLVSGQCPRAPDLGTAALATVWAACAVVFASLAVLFAVSAVDLAVLAVVAALSAVVFAASAVDLALAAISAAAVAAETALLASRIASAALLISFRSAASAAVTATVPAFWAAVSICWTIPSKDHSGLSAIWRSRRPFCFHIGQRKIEIAGSVSSIAIIHSLTIMGVRGDESPRAESGRQPIMLGRRPNTAFPFRQISVIRRRSCRLRAWLLGVPARVSLTLTELISLTACS